MIGIDTPMRYRRLVVTVLGIIVSFSGCEQPSGKQQLTDVVTALKVNAKKIAAGTILKVPLSSLKQGQILVVINSSYAGSIKAGSYISDKLKTKITLDYSTSETGKTFLLLIENEEIVASLGVPGDVFITDSEPFFNNAKMATPDRQIALLSCVDPGSQSIGRDSSWSPNCSTIKLVGFDE